MKKVPNRGRENAIVDNAKVGKAVNKKMVINHRIRGIGSHFAGPEGVVRVAVGGINGLGKGLTSVRRAWNNLDARQSQRFHTTCSNSRPALKEKRKKEG